MQIRATIRNCEMVDWATIRIRNVDIQTFRED
jgi:hypothetical protein